MYICLCLGVTDREIKQTIAEGACTVEDVMYCTGAGTRCGSCVETIADLLEEASAGHDVSSDANEVTESTRRALPVLRHATSAA